MKHKILVSLDEQRISDLDRLKEHYKMPASAIINMAIMRLIEENKMKALGIETRPAHQPLMSWAEQERRHQTGTWDEPTVT